MSDLELSDGADNDKSSQAAAMDALNLDDLFLGGGNNDEEPLADSLFADMDIDLGDIMDGIIGEAGGNMSAVVSEEFGGGIVDGPSPDLDPISSIIHGDTSISSDVPPSNNYENVEKGKNVDKGKTKSRTARSNPHLAMAQKQEQQQQKESRIAKQLGISGSDHSPSQILSPTAKRRRRKSKKFSSDDGEELVLDESAGIAAAEAYAAAKKSSSRRRAKISNTLDASVHSNSSTQSTQGLLAASATGQMSVTEEEKIEQGKIEQQHQFSQHGLDQEFQSHQFQSQSPEKKEDAEQRKRKAKEKEEKRKLLLKKEQGAISKFGLAASHTLFFPYMQLPVEVDVKKRGHKERGYKAYPCLDKLNSRSDVRYQPQADLPEDQSENEENKIEVSINSPLYKLFHTHLGALTNNQGNDHPPEALQSSLAKSIRKASSILKKKESNKVKEILIDELSKLYTGCMKQSAFLRQNMWNMERWCSNQLTEEEFKGTYGVVRRDVEWVLRMMQEMKQRRLEQQRQQKIRAAQLLEQQKLQKIQQREQQQKLLLQQEQAQLQKQLEKQRQKQKIKLKKIVAPDKNCLPFPETLPGAPTHGGPNTTPVISMKVKIKLSGWRDKSGTKLNARLWSPADWKTAMKRERSIASAAAAAAAAVAAETNAAATLAASSKLEKIEEMIARTVEGGVASTADTAVPEASLISNQSSQSGAATAVVMTPALDVSSVVSKATLEAVASELVRPDLMPKSSSLHKSDSPIAQTSSSLPLTTATTVTKSSAPTTITSGGGVALEEGRGEKKQEKKKTNSRRRKIKDDAANYSISSSSAAALSSKSSASTSHNKKRQRFIPHVPSFNRSNHLHYHSAILAPAASGASGSRSGNTNKYTVSGTVKKEESELNNDPQQQRSRLLHFLYTKIFSSSSPAERRALLADEISSTHARLEQARRSGELPKLLHVQKKLEELKSVSTEDMEICPETVSEHGNTKGMWNWITGNDYFDELDTAEDVHDRLKYCWQPELDERQLRLEEDRECWGSLLPSPPLTDKKGVIKREESAAAENSSVKEEQSPLFDRLQSLLVEVDEEGSDEDDNLISDLPDYSPEEFIHGPNKNHENALPDDGMMDVSALTLDQRTYVQLRAVGLVAGGVTPQQFIAAASTKPATRKTRHVENDDSIDAILYSMKSHLSTLHVKTNVEVASLQRKALSHVVRAPQRRQQVCDNAAVLVRYEQFQKAQSERRKDEEKQRQIIIRTSGRVKTGTNKFDGDKWLPW